MIRQNDGSRYVEGSFAFDLLKRLTKQRNPLNIGENRLATIRHNRKKIQAARDIQPPIVAHNPISYPV
ncbi:hypothetical protein QLH52_03160 [Methylomonas sp. OY6]|uniref:Uncharacterized protein n=1 Tax=Methylomonas defluvii TaxID=3045149 RepID=A0ABU4UBN8_9GAMM|nr:hypothetical protein [Methylomonas sp. OY6]MDX8126265.1 hypothetical protein [Methylomonas sp. OY6]